MAAFDPNRPAHLQLSKVPEIAKEESLVLPMKELESQKLIVVNQLNEPIEIFGFETKNKYEILDSEKNQIGFAAEVEDGSFGFIQRQIFGHWRTFEIHFYDQMQKTCLIARHPFRFWLQCLEVETLKGEPLGVIQQQFSLFSRKFVVTNFKGQIVFQVSSPLWRLWTFAFESGGREKAYVKKRWSGALSEMFTDRDNFGIEFADSRLPLRDRLLVLAAAVFVDLQYFERKAKR